jgi:hypothetical protein
LSSSSNSEEVFDHDMLLCTRRCLASLNNIQMPKSFLTTTRLESLRQQLQQEQNVTKATKRGTKKNLQKPSWLKAQVPKGDNYEALKSTVRSLNLATVCEEAKCPNIGGM